VCAYPLLQLGQLLLVEGIQGFQLSILLLQLLSLTHTHTHTHTQVRDRDQTHTWYCSRRPEVQTYRGIDTETHRHSERPGEERPGEERPGEERDQVRRETR